MRLFSVLLSLVMLICIIHTGVPAQTLSSSRDWFDAWKRQFEVSDSATNTGGDRCSGTIRRFPSPVACDLNNRLSYEPGRYMLPAIIYASEVIKSDQVLWSHYKSCFERYADYIFRDDYYRDVGQNIKEYYNGIDDGFLGWYNASSSHLVSSNYWIPTSINRSVWNTIKINVRCTDDSAHTTMITVFVNNEQTPYYRDSLICGVEYLKGSIALIGGWADVKYRNLSIYELRDSGNRVLLYSIDTSYNNERFKREWAAVKIDNDSATTAEIGREWLVDSGGAVSCKAASYAPIGIPTKSRMFGKYAAVVLDSSFLYRNGKLIENCEIDLQMMILKRNIATSESGVALRWNCDLGRDPLTGVVRYAKFPYFVPNAKYIAVKLHPPSILQVVRHSNTWWYGPWDEDGVSALNGKGYCNDGITFDFQVCATVAHGMASFESVKTDYIRKYFESSNSVISKWERSWDKDNKDWNYGYNGNGGSISFGGWRLGCFWVTYYGRVGLFFAWLTRLGSKSHMYYYKSNYRDFCDSLLCSDLWILRNSRNFQWQTSRDYIGEMDGRDGSFTAAADYGGPIVEFMKEAHRDSVITGVHHEHMARLAETFVSSMWNQKLGDSTSINQLLNGKGDTIVVLSEWPHLSQYDYKVWEIVDEYCNKSIHNWNEYSNIGAYKNIYGRLAAEMMYCVRYATPKEIRIDTLDVISEEGKRRSEDYVLAWSPPSDFRIGYYDSAERRRRPGTRMRYYCIYRRKLVDIRNQDSIWSDWSRNDCGGCNGIVRIEIRKEDYSEGLCWQEAVKNPYYYDSTAMKGMTYQYFVTTQDWSNGIVNQSIGSKIVTVTYKDRINMTMLKRRKLLKNERMVLNDGNYMAPWDVLLESGSKLILGEKAKIYCLRNCQIMGEGKINRVNQAK
jgi:hypothetical protein